LASIAMVLNALSIDPTRPWKGSWRWFHEELLDCCLPLNKVAQEGVVLTQVSESMGLIPSMSCVHCSEAGAGWEGGGCKWVWPLLPGTTCPLIAHSS
jgi:hypothetical protein